MILVTVSGIFIHKSYLVIVSMAYWNTTKEYTEDLKCIQSKSEFLRFRVDPGFSLLPYSLSSVKLIIDAKYLNLWPLYNLNQIISVQKVVFR